jgi:hypothetical protein
MGRIVDLCGEVAAAADEGPEGLILPPEAWDRLRADWEEEDIEDAMGFVRDSLLQGELVEAADSISARLVEVLGTFGEARAFQEAVAGNAEIGIDVIRQLAHRVERLEEVLEAYREGRGPERTGFDALQRRLLDQGIEGEMGQDEEEEEQE